MIRVMGWCWRWLSICKLPGALRFPAAPALFPPAHYTLNRLGLAGVEEIGLATPDGERLVAWYKPVPAPSPCCSIFTATAADCTSGQRL